MHQTATLKSGGRTLMTGSLRGGLIHFRRPSSTHVSRAYTLTCTSSLPFPMPWVHINLLSVWPLLAVDDRACEPILSEIWSINLNQSCIPSGFKFSQLEMSQSRWSRPCPHSEYSHPLEVVLSLLVESFRFSPSEKEVIWQMNGLATPTVPSSGSSRSQLPLRVEKVV